jgi:hypothetical protein
MKNIMRFRSFFCLTCEGEIRERLLPAVLIKYGALFAFLSVLFVVWLSKGFDHLNGLIVV